MELLKRIKKLEKRVEELEKMRGKNKIDLIANFIEAQFKKDEEVLVRDIMEKGKDLGFSVQMISRARRELLEDKIVVCTKRGKGWTWKKI